MGYIYKITNTLNNKSYIGQTKYSIGHRYNQHCNEALHTNNNLHLYNAMRKYGLQNFKVSCLESDIPEDLLDEKEVYYINYFNTYEDGYNNTKGGGGVRGYHHSDATKKKIGETVRQNMYKINTPERTAKIIASQKGRKFTELHKLHIKESCAGKRTGEHNAFYGKTHTELSKLKMSQSSIKYKVLQLDSNNVVINCFPSVREAASFIKNNNLSNAKLSSIMYRIYYTCIGNQNIAYNFKWKYEDKCIDYSERK